MKARTDSGRDAMFKTAMEAAVKAASEGIDSSLFSVPSRRFVTSFATALGAEPLPNHHGCGLHHAGGHAAHDMTPLVSLWQHKCQLMHAPDSLQRPMQSADASPFARLRFMSCSLGTSMMVTANCSDDCSVPKLTVRWLRIPARCS